LELPKFGIGFTDLAKKASETATGLADSDYHIRSFAGWMAQSGSQIIAFNGKEAGARSLERRTGKKPTGFQIERVGKWQI
jgi:hypothetical protein